MGWGAQSILDPSHAKDRVSFVKSVAAGTGLSFDTVWGWTAKEGGSFRNPLGVNYAGGTNPPQYASTDTAARETIKFLQGSNYAALRGVAARRYPSDSLGRLAELGAEAQAIASSPFGPWGNNLTDATKRERDNYARTIVQSGAAADKALQSLDANTIAAAGLSSAVEPNLAGKIKKSTGIDKIADILGWPFANPWRTLEIVGGSILLLVGIVLLARQAGAPMPSVPNPLSRATDPVEAAFSQGEEQGLRSAARSAGRSSGKARYQAPSQGRTFKATGDDIPY